MNRRAWLLMPLLALLPRRAHAQWGSTTLPIQLPANAPLNTVGRIAYQVATPATGGTVTIADGIGVLLIQGSSVLLAVTVRLPPNPVDMQIIRVVSQVAITALSVQSGAGVALSSSIALGVLGGGSLWQYQGTAWQRIG